ncbi:TRFEA protein, partial [Polyodon spathula]|nr:TRFEA protein [Polyodon spathula]
METLSNRSSCHTEMKRTAGWVVPVGFLVSRNIITVHNRDFAGGTNPAPWARDLKAADFKLLCEDGSTAPLWQYTTCNLATVPAYAVMTQASRRHQVFRFLDDAQVCKTRPKIQQILASW